MRLPVLLVAALTIAPSLAVAQSAPVNRYGNPERMRPAPTAPAITPRDLQIRLYQFADDSMQGRQVGRVGNKKGTDYIAAEVKRLGLLPAGDNGTYFQVLPYHLRKFTEHSKLTVDGNPLQWNVDFVAVPGARAPRPALETEVIFGGVLGDTLQQIPADMAAGKVVVVLPSPTAARAGGAGFGGRGGFAPQGSPRFADAVAVVTVDLDGLTPAQRAAINEPTAAQLAWATPPRTPPSRPGVAPAAVDSVALLKAQLAALQPPAQLRMTSAAAARLFRGTPVQQLTRGTTGGLVTTALHFVEIPTEFGRNVVAVIPGSDPVLKHQYVAIGAHNDHVGFTTPVDKDSLKAFNDARMRLMIANDMQLGPELLAQIRVNMDSIRKLHPTPRLDSINNGADDDGSGSMGVLEVAEAIAAMPVKPKRSVLFVWHTGEEAGLIGANYFTRNPTVPMDSVVAQLNVDMIGRGRAEDLPGGGDDYLAVVGSYFDSKDLGETVKAVNGAQAAPLRLDYKFDDPIAWSGYNNIYGRSDHYMYAQQGVPIAFFFTGLHGDYHQRTDEAEFIDYPHYARITNFIKDLTVAVANGPRPQLNGTRPAKPRPIVP
jgi:hypothetical protein